MTEFVTTAVIDQGKFRVRNRQQFDEVIRSWPDGEYLVRIERLHATRSSQANRYYWGVVIATISEHTGYTPEETHDVLKTMFLPKQVAMLNGNGFIANELVIGGSTAKLTRVEFGEYVARIREWAMTVLELDIPSAMPPEESAHGV
jgi:hypothetical protein